MASLDQFTTLVQPLLALLVTNATLDSAFTNATQNGTVSDTPSQMLTDFSSLLAAIFSMSDYFKFIVLGGALEVLRRIYSASYSSLVDLFVITASFDSDDMAFSE